MPQIRRNFNAKRKPYNKMTASEKLHDAIYNSDILIEKILNARKIRYDILNQIFKKIPEHITTVTMYIDLHSILNSLYNPSVLESVSSLTGEKSFIISSNIINMAAHFRHYFASRKTLYTNFVFFYSSKKAKREMIIFPDYKKDFYEKRLGNNSEFIIMNRLIKDNIRICKIISDYLPHIYFVDSGELNPNLVPYHFINSQDDDEMSIIYSNDRVQIINCLQNKNTYLLRFNSSEIEFYSQMELLKAYSKKDEYDLNPQLLPYLFSISGNKKYNIDGFKNFGEIKACNFISKLIRSQKISNINYKAPSVFLDEIKESLTPEQYNILDRNIKLFHIPTIYNELSEADLLKFIVYDYQDMKALVDINSEYYEKYPLDLEALMIGEEYKSI